MNQIWETIWLIAPVLFPILCGIYVLTGRNNNGRKFFIIIVLTLQCIFTLMAWRYGAERLVLWQFTKNIPILFQIDTISLIFTGLLSAVWLLTGIYSCEYMKHEDEKEHEEGRTRSLPDKIFYGFYLMVLGVMTGLGYAGNLVTFYLFYEFMTLLSVPFVIHTMTKEAIFAAKKYLFYSVAGASMALIGFAFLYSLSGGNLEFSAGGMINAAMTNGQEWKLLLGTFFIILGFGTKAGMFPMHGWLPSAHPVAPAPASAVLSGMITKAGVLGIIRTLYYFVGVDHIKGTWVQTVFTILSLITVFMGSMLAYREKVLKKRLAYSTVSQVSYVLFGLSLLHPVAFVGAILHIIFHSLMKTTLFLNAGAIIYKTGKTKVDELTEIGVKMPITVWTFTIASLGLIGIPPFCGFISKWYLCTGSLDTELGAVMYLGPAVLLISALLTAGYLLPITIKGFFPGEECIRPKRDEVNKTMWIPMVILSIAIVLLGLIPNGLVDVITKITLTIF